MITPRHSTLVHKLVAYKRRVVRHWKPALSTAAIITGGRAADGSSVGVLRMRVAT